MHPQPGDVDTHEWQTTSRFESVCTISGRVLPAIKMLICPLSARHVVDGMCALNYRCLLKAALFAVLLLVSAAVLGAEVRYARNFSLSDYQGYTVAEVKGAHLKDATASLRYVFIDPGAADLSVVRNDIRERFPGIRERRIFEPPITSFVSLSTTYLPALLMLDRVEALTGVDDGAYVYSPEIRQRIEAGEVAELGTGGRLDTEKLLELGPDAVMMSGAAGQWNTAPKLRKAGIPVLISTDYLERSPLGRAEWIKFYALLFGEREKADRLFRTIEERYLQLRRKAAGAEGLPAVLLNRPMRDKWVVPGGRSYMSRFIADAGGRYLWEKNRSRSSLVLDPEAVFARALEADVWLHQYGWDSLADVTAANKSFSRIPAVQNGQVVNNDRRVTEKGANDFYESGASRPDRVLADLVKIFHPEMLTDHELYYYRYLR